MFWNRRRAQIYARIYHRAIFVRLTRWQFQFIYVKNRRERKIKNNEKYEKEEADEENAFDISSSIF